MNDNEVPRDTCFFFSHLFILSFWSSVPPSSKPLNWYVLCLLLFTLALLNSFISRFIHILSPLLHPDLMFIPFHFPSFFNPFFPFFKTHSSSFLLLFFSYPCLPLLNFYFLSSLLPRFTLFCRIPPHMGWSLFPFTRVIPCVRPCLLLVKKRMMYDRYIYKTAPFQA